MIKKEQYEAPEIEVLELRMQQGVLTGSTEVEGMTWETE